ncbi:hypothetical protein CMV30_17420 [Nibricoccus aquaticus]|uniref:Uncharacterized protein n=1 Tax=Nibricoccus aquaticus TaxID=2576891 RepID=A0A290QLB3_9BACT|nr:YeeE/YedE thiosulfate transporter family protein [Nibricoccus aquaticus]ATC66218.1 hypothetical protein CMV30_17420 [Nibricoccus aquaticus]
MFSENYSSLHALAGGVLIGLGTLLACAATGNTIGISGVFSKVLRRKRGEMVRWALFLAGLMTGALVVMRVFPAATVFASRQSLYVVALAGVLVGFGTRFSGGCTSGHGVSGIGMGSKSGIVATVVFMAAGMATVYVIKHVVGGLNS